MSEAAVDGAGGAVASRSAKRRRRRGGAVPPPAGYVAIGAGSGHAVVAEAALARVRRALESAGTLHRFAAEHPDARALRGRDVVYSIPADGSADGRWMVRHYRRGGPPASFLGDRFLRLGAPRPFRELHASLEVAARGVPTPRVVAAVVYPAGPVYRGDLVTVEVPGAADLAEILFGDDGRDREERVAACEAAGKLVQRLCDCGVLHPDLNLKNVLIQMTRGEARAFLLDLDLCRTIGRVSPRRAAAMRRRLARSLRKWEAATGRSASPAERAAMGVPA
jgi:3-deoxy-D-manno-octulosonic acid kinase